MAVAPTGLKWSADSRTIYSIGWTWPDAADDAAHKAKEKALKEAKSKAVVIDDTQYRIWDKWIADGKRPMIFATDVESGRHRNLLAKSKRFLPPTEPPPSATDYDVSPDGKELCFVSDSAKDYGTDFNSDLYTLNLVGDAEPQEHHPGQPGERHEPGLQSRRQAHRVPAADDQALLCRPPATDGARPGCGHDQGVGRRIQPVVPEPEMARCEAPDIRSRERRGRRHLLHQSGGEDAVHATRPRCPSDRSTSPAAGASPCTCRAASTGRRPSFAHGPGYEGPDPARPFQRRARERVEARQGREHDLQGSRRQGRAAVDRVPAGLRRDQEMAVRASRARRPAQRHHERLELSLEPPVVGRPGICRRVREFPWVERLRPGVHRLDHRRHGRQAARRT